MADGGHGAATTSGGSGVVGTGGRGAASGGTFGSGGVSIIDPLDLTDPYANCGNGIVDPGEACDDDNVESGDGCSRYCTREPGWECPVDAPCGPVVCGDGRRGLTEVCDDGNRVAGDGCYADCSAVEAGWQCLAQPPDLGGSRCVPVCGDGVVVGDEECDIGIPGEEALCTNRCRWVPSVVCMEGGTCTTIECGNGVVEATEACDLGGNNGVFRGDGTGCSEWCTVEPLCETLETGELACPAVCGNADLEAGEDCDDGNQREGDGCSETCTLEAGFVCDQEVVGGRSPSRCVPHCGDGVVVRDEICDDGDANGTRDYGGCTRDCQPGSYCGDGVLDVANEECDDGVRNVFVYDEPGGCTPDCKLTPFCGDRVVDLQFDEACDDGTGYGNPVGVCAHCRMWTGP